ncbi:PAS domain-containing sensor histidine kinase [Candidatus Wolfebacteria bacterium]|nr:PAS domain-containing sensor histidine kinase [Candidatus Wolfebacteria bacterium]
MMKALMGCMPDSIYFKNIEGEFLLVNEAKAANSNTAINEMLGKTDFDFMSLDEAEKAYLDDQNVIETGQVIRDKVEKLTRQDGAEKWVSVTKAPYLNSDGEIVGVIGISRDITQRIAVEKHILDMLSITVHDLRGPLVSIEATTKLLIKGSFGKIDDSVKATLQDVFERVKKLTKIVNEYLVKSFLMHAEIPPKENFDLREDIIDPILDEFANDIQENQITIDNKLGAIPGDRIIIKANKNWLRIVYRNLISNAIKYGGTGCVIAFGFEEFGDYYKLNVYNNGPCVPEEERTRIFDKFYSQGSKGTGIGLWIIRNLIRKHGGDMRYENSLDDHPNFVFTIPKDLKE